MLQKVLVPLNLHESAAMVLDMCQYLKNFGTDEILLLHVGSNSTKSTDKNLRHLRLYAQELEKVDFKTSLFTRSGSTQLETIKLAEEENAHYISIPFRKKNWLSYALLGSRVKDIIRQSDIPVFVYRKKTTLKIFSVYSWPFRSRVRIKTWPCILNTMISRLTWFTWYMQASVPLTPLLKSNGRIW